MIVKSNETQPQDDQLERLVDLWSELTPTVRRSLLALAEGAARLQQLNRVRDDDRARPRWREIVRVDG